jgi:hypothetical protein
MKYLLGLLLSLLVVASLAKADIIPVSGTAAFTNDWSYSASGPSFAFQGGESAEHSIYALQEARDAVSTLLLTLPRCRQGKTVFAGVNLVASSFRMFQRGRNSVPSFNI